jgi:DNA-3-methyladenine glycosylase I
LFDATDLWRMMWLNMKFNISAGLNAVYQILLNEKSLSRKPVTLRWMSRRCYECNDPREDAAVIVKPHRRGVVMSERHRCAWAESDPLLREYHDTEWGVPQHDSRALWEMLMLEGFQAGLSWLTILRKRDAFREAFANFDPEVVAKFDEKDIARLLENAGIIRSRAKIVATIAGARIYVDMKKAGEDFSEYVWTMAGGKPIKNTTAEVLAKTPLSETISASLKKRGFKFVGPVIVYAWMQAVGIANDHSNDCFRRKSKKWRSDRSQAERKQLNGNNIFHEDLEELFAVM